MCRWTVPSFASKPIPRALVRSSRDYRQVPVSKGPRSSEPIEDVRLYGVNAESYYARTDRLNPPYYAPIPGAARVVRARREICRRLARVNARIRPLGLELLVLDAHRTLECQRGLWAYFVASARQQLPGASTARIDDHVLRFCSDPRHFDSEDSTTWPTHLTGGAVDVTLTRRGQSGERLFMGGVFDDPSDTSRTDYYESSQHGRTASDLEARRNRRLLFWAMRGAGFANLSTEWWHYDWGTQLWAFSSGKGRSRKPRAFYGPL
jgi:D-alanyl-D-alanine dipeptidase